MSYKPSYTSKIAEDIMAERLIRAQAVEFLSDAPMRLKSGLISPVYVDNRKLFFHPEAWNDIIETMASRVEEYDLKFDVVAGVEAAGSMHAAALAYRLGLPAIMVRQKAKTYGNRSRIEGGDVKGLNILLLEDHISTGLSCLDAIRALREEGAEVTQVMSITNYAIPETMRLFAEQGIATYDAVDLGGHARRCCNGSRELIFNVKPMRLRRFRPMARRASCRQFFSILRFLDRLKAVGWAAASASTCCLRMERSAALTACIASAVSMQSVVPSSKCRLERKWPLRWKKSFRPCAQPASRLMPLRMQEMESLRRTLSS